MQSTTQIKIRLPLLRVQDETAMEIPLELPDIPYQSTELPVLNRRALMLEGRPYRASSYTIYADLPGNPSEMLLVHAYTGAYDKVSQRVATYIRALETRHAPKPLYGDWEPEPPTDGVAMPPSKAAVAILKKRGYLTQLTPDEEESFFAALASKIHLRALRRPPSYVLMPTYQCNLRCPYCFQDHMRTDPTYSHLLRTVDRAMVNRIVQGMGQIERLHGSEGMTRSVVLFGGEPLLAENRSIIEYAIDEMRKTNRTKVSAITNGTDLHVYDALLGPDGISNLQITIDGPAREHDKRRIYADGTGTFGRIAQNVTMALGRGVHVSLRMNIDRSNIVHLPELADEFEKRGWFAQREFSAYVAPIHGKKSDAKSALTTWQLNQALADLKARHPILARLRDGDSSLMDKARTLFNGRADPLSGFKASFCGAHNSMYVIDAFADLYACWERTGDPDVRIGRIAEDGRVLMNPKVMKAWRSRNVTSNPACRKCRYSTYCGGGCAVLAEEHAGRMHTNFCDGYAKRFRASLAMAYTEHARGVGSLPVEETLCDN